MLSLSCKVFLEVAVNLSFSKAAKKLFISQPAISRHVRLLEDEYGCALFERQGNSIFLTESGLKVYDYLVEAQVIERKIDFDISRSKKEADGRGILKVGASTTVSLYILPEILSAFHSNMPRVELQVVNRNTENIVTALLNKHIDVAIVEVEHKTNQFNYDYFTSDKVIAVCSARSPLADTPKLSLKDLLKVSVALRESGSGTQSALNRELLKIGISEGELNSRVRLGGTEALKNFILADLSLGFLPQRAVKKELMRGELVELDINGLSIERNFFFLTRFGDSFDLIKKFIKFSKHQILSSIEYSKKLSSDK